MKTLIALLLAIVTTSIAYGQTVENTNFSTIVYKVSDETRDNLMEMEKFTSCSYFDRKRVSIGYGSQLLENNKPVPLHIKGKRFCISKERAVKLFDNTIKRKANLIILYSMDNSIKINQKILDSLVSFSYNVGSAGLFKSKIMFYLQNNKCHLAAKTMLKYNKSNGEILKGLVIRRHYEAKLLLSGCKELNNDN